MIFRAKKIPKTAPRSNFAPLGPRSGIVLLDCTVYCALLALIFALSYGAYIHCLDNSKALQRNSMDIVRALDAGERWRKDIRLGSSITCSNDVIKIKQQSNTIEYQFRNGEIWRKSGLKSDVRLLSNVKASEMNSDKRSQLTAWRWEIELQPRQKNAKTKPLFTFQAVPAKTQ